MCRARGPCVCGGDAGVGGSLKDELVKPHKQVTFKQIPENKVKEASHEVI